MPDGNAIDPRQRLEDHDEAQRQHGEAREAQIWTALPGIVEELSDDGNTVKVKSAVKMQRVKSDGSLEWVEIPTLEDVPIHHYGAGGVTLTVPAAKGNEGLIVFNSRSIDKWWQEGGVQEQAESRTHSLSDGWFIPGGRSQPKKLKDVSRDTFQLRTDDGKQYLDFDPKKNQITWVSPNPILCKTDLHVTGEVISKYGTDNIHSSTHTHNSVEPGAGHTNKPDTGT